MAVTLAESLVARTAAQKAYSLVVRKAAGLAACSEQSTAESWVDQMAKKKVACSVERMVRKSAEKRAIQMVAPMAAATAARMEMYSDL